MRRFLIAITMASVTASAHLRGNLVYDVAERTDACRPAFVASDAPVNLQMSHVNPLCLNALLLQNAFHFVQGCRCITVITTKPLWLMPLPRLTGILKCLISVVFCWFIFWVSIERGMRDL